MTLGVGLTVLIGLSLAVGFLVRRKVFVVGVVGRSMTPTYRDGERALAIRTRRVRTGDVVVFTMPPDGRPHLAPGASPIMVKRVVAAPVNGAPIVVAGDAPRSLDSSVFGPVDRDLVIGRVIRPRRRPA